MRKRESEAWGPEQRGEPGLNLKSTHYSLPAAPLSCMECASVFKHHCRTTVIIIIIIYFFPNMGTNVMFLLFWAKGTNILFLVYSLIKNEFSVYNDLNTPLLRFRFFFRFFLINFNIFWCKSKCQGDTTFLI